MKLKLDVNRLMDSRGSSAVWLSPAALSSPDGGGGFSPAMAV